MGLAEDIGGWKTLQGLETLVTQGMWQFEYWTGIRVRDIGVRMCRVSLKAIPK
jgi:shikimate 5-dehydrogenase